MCEIFLRLHMRGICFQRYPGTLAVKLGVSAVSQLEITLPRSGVFTPLG